MSLHNVYLGIVSILEAVHTLKELKALGVLPPGVPWNNWVSLQSLYWNCIVGGRISLHSATVCIPELASSHARSATYQAHPLISNWVIPGICCCGLFFLSSPQSASYYMLLRMFVHLLAAWILSVRVRRNSSSCTRILFLRGNGRSAELTYSICLNLLNLKSLRHQPFPTHSRSVVDLYSLRAVSYISKQENDDGEFPFFPPPRSVSFSSRVTRRKVWIDQPSYLAGIVHW